MNATSAVERLTQDLAKARPFETGTVIAWTSVSGTGSRYEYAAIYASGAWYTTLERPNARLSPKVTHDELLDYFSENTGVENIRVATEFQEVTL